MKLNGSPDVRLEDLQAEHRSLDRRLRELVRKGHPSSDEMLEIASLKKRKLAAKDRIDEIARQAS